MSSEAVCFLLLAHQPPAQLGALLGRWEAHCPPPSQLLLCYGGSRENFQALAYEPRIFIDDPRLRTRNHQEERQSYTQIFQKASAWMEAQPQFTHVYLAEYDHWPLVPDLAQRLIQRAREEGADVLAHQLSRRDRTCCTHYNSHVGDPRFLPWLASLSVREDTGAVFNMLGTGSFWTREAFLAVGRRTEPFPIYLELYLPTLAHHLGYRLRDFRDQNEFTVAQGNLYDQIESARARGAWTLHPVKQSLEGEATG